MTPESELPLNLQARSCSTSGGLVGEGGGIVVVGASCCVPGAPHGLKYALITYFRPLSRHYVHTGSPRVLGHRSRADCYI